MSPALAAHPPLLSLKTQFLALADCGLSRFSHINYLIDADGAANAPKTERAVGFGKENMRPQNMFGKLIAPLAALVFALALACGTGSESETAERPPAPSPIAQAERGAPVMPTGEIGFGLGDRVPEFEISLTSGEALSAAQLRASERPTFLFFFSMT